MEYKKIINLLEPNKYSRPLTKLKSVKAVVIHYVGNPNSTALANRNYWNNLPVINKNSKNVNEIYASAHYIIDFDGSQLQAVPEDETAYHCGAAAYKEDALSKISSYPNNSSIGIELVHRDWTGSFESDTYNSAVSLTIELLEKYNLSIENVFRHYDITGKMCPKYFVENNSRWISFLNDVKSELKNI